VNNKNRRSTYIVFVSIVLFLNLLQHSTVINNTNMLKCSEKMTMNLLFIELNKSQISN